MSGSIKKTMNDKIIGIDLGTTNSVVAVMDNNIPKIIANEFGNNMTPSVVKIGPKEKVGKEAVKYLLNDFRNTIFGSKRLIGRKFDDPIIREYITTLPYSIVRACNEDILISTDYGRYSPTQIGSKILSKMKQYAEKYLGYSVKRAVITVPAYFNDIQRQATKDAGRIAGLDVLRIINEPTAAALAYGLDKKDTGHVIVYDLGGGTFDVSVLELNDGIFHVKATNGDTFLGGIDFDKELIKWFIEKFKEEEGISLSIDNLKELNKEKINSKMKFNIIGFEKLRYAAEMARKTLSTKEFYNVYIENLLPGHDLNINLTREQLERIIAKVAQRTVEPCLQVMKDAGINKSQISHVIVVGGMTRMPYIRKLVKEIFGCEPYTEINPDEAIACGAAIQAGVLNGNVKDVLLLDVAPLSLGIEVQGGIFSKIVDRNTTIPFRHTETFSTSEDNQSKVDINIYQGERRMVHNNKLLGKLCLQNITPALRGIPKINVTFTADANGLITVEATEDTKNICSINLKPDSGLTEFEINRMVLEAKSKQIEDEIEEKRALLCTEFENYIKEISKIQIPSFLNEKIIKLKKLSSNVNFDITEFSELFKTIKNII